MSHIGGASRAVQHARRTMEICNACRYCEGFCAVFPAMELRRSFAESDLIYLANLCHACRGCFYACQYAPPHEFGIDVPTVLADMRAVSYAKYAWPAPLARLYRRNGLMMSIAIVLGMAGATLLAVLFGAQPVVPGRGFYNVLSYRAMAGAACVIFAFPLLAFAIGFARFWKDTGGQGAELIRVRPVLQALRDAATLRYLGGGGHGCNDHDERFSTRRRWFHHLMAYGFLLCFASTSVATVYHHLLGWSAPYGLASLPVLLGTVGGIGIMAGTAGLFRLKLAGGRAADAGLLLSLLLIAMSGLLLLALRDTRAMSAALMVHLSLVLGFFVTMPFGTFVHGLYRTGALIRHAIERPGG